MPTRFKGTEEEIRALNAYINLKRAHDSVYAKVERSLGVQGFTVTQFGALEALYHLGSLCQRDLAKKVLKTSGNLTTVISNLVKRGFVKRGKGGTDQRYISIDLTAKGRSHIGQAFPLHVAHVLRLMRALEPEEQETLRALCRRLGKGARSSLN